MFALKSLFGLFLFGVFKHDGNEAGEGAVGVVEFGFGDDEVAFLACGVDEVVFVGVAGFAGGEEGVVAVGNFLGFFGKIWVDVEDGFAFDFFACFLEEVFESFVAADVLEVGVLVEDGGGNSVADVEQEELLLCRGKRCWIRLAH